MSSVVHDVEQTRLHRQGTVEEKNATLDGRTQDGAV